MGVKASRNCPESSRPSLSLRLSSHSFSDGGRSIEVDESDAAISGKSGKSLNAEFRRGGTLVDRIYRRGPMLKPDIWEKTNQVRICSSFRKSSLRRDCPESSGIPI